MVRWPYKSLVYSVALLMAAGCSPERRPRDIPTGTVRSSDGVGLPSPDGRVVANVIYEEDGSGQRWQHMTLTTAAGEPVAIRRKGNLRYPARFNVYWRWDGNDLLWISNSDDGSIWYVTRNKHDWLARRCTSKSKVGPPVELYVPRFRPSERIRDGRVRC